MNALVGFGTILGVYFLALWGFKDTKVALGAACFAAFLPMMCALDGAISNDPLLFCGITWTLALLAHAIQEGWNWKNAVWIGIVAGITLNTKTTALVVLPTIFVGAFLGKRPTSGMVFAVFGIAVALAIPWWIRNNHVYGDAFALKAFVTGFDNPHPQDIIPSLPGGAFEYWTSWFGWWTIRSFFGTFGYMDIFLNSSGLAFPPARMGDTEILYRLLLVGFLAVSVGFLASLKKEEWKEAKPIHILNFIALFLVLALYLRFNLTYFQAQGRYVLPAIGPIACGVAVGVSYLSKTRKEVGVAILAAVLLSLNIYALGRLPAEFEARTNVSSL